MIKSKVMVMMMIASLLLGMVMPMRVLEVEAASTHSSKTVSVLLIGNSMVKRKNNTTVSNLKNLAKKSGRKIKLEYVAYSGEKMKNWANPKNKHGKEAYKKISSRNWDVIILQENTDWAIAHGDTFVSASRKLAKYIKKECPNARIIYNCTWAYKKTKKIGNKKYSFSTQQKNMNANYVNAANVTGGTVCWSGNAFREYRNTKGAKNLYLKDNNHATAYGWYLNACCMYACIFETSPAEAHYYAGLNKKICKKMQTIAADVNL